MMLLAILAYVLLQLGIAVWAARGTSSDDDYLVAGRGLGTLSVALSIFATWFAAETVIATSAETAADGLAGARVEPFGYGLGIVVLALFVAFRLRSGGYLTIAGFMGDRFGQKVEVMSAVVVALGATVWAAAQLAALATLIDEASAVGFGAALFAGTAIVLIYTWLGGLKGDVFTDVLQGAVITAGLLVLLILLVLKAGGPGEAVAAIPEGALAMRKDGESWLERAELWMLPILGTIVAQEAISRTLAAKSPEIARRGALLGAGIYVFIGLIPVSLGLVGSGLLVGRDEGDAFLAILAQTLLPGWLYVILTGALLSAILSSVDSALLSVSAVATESGYRKWKPLASPGQRLVAARVVTLASGITAAIVAASGESLRDIVLTAEGITGILSVPLVAGLTLKTGGRLAGLAAITTSAAMTVVLDWILGVPGAFLFALAGGGVMFLAFYAAERLTAPTRYRESPEAREAQ